MEREKGEWSPDEVGPEGKGQPAKNPKVLKPHAYNLFKCILIDKT